MTDSNPVTAQLKSVSEDITAVSQLFENRAANDVLAVSARVQGKCNVHASCVFKLMSSDHVLYPFFFLRHLLRTAWYLHEMP